MPRAKCAVTGKEIWGKAEARQALPGFRSVHKGRGTIKWCVFCQHYHFTKGLNGQKGRKDHR